jgi:hypothetical protein
MIAETETHEKPRLGLGLWPAGLLCYGGSATEALGQRARARGGVVAQLRRQNGELTGAEAVACAAAVDGFGGARDYGGAGCGGARARAWTVARQRRRWTAAVAARL